MKDNVKQPGGWAAAPRCEWGVGGRTGAGAAADEQMESNEEKDSWSPKTNQERRCPLRLARVLRVRELPLLYLSTIVTIPHDQRLRT